MVNIDLNKPDPTLTPGVDLWEILTAEETQSKAGTPMISLKFRRVANPDDHLYDLIMLGGKGWSIGKRKLTALLGDGFAGDLDLLMLVGRRVWLSTKIEEYNGNESLKVAIDGELRRAGYQDESDVPAGCTPPEIEKPPF